MIVIMKRLMLLRYLNYLEPCCSIYYHSNFSTSQICNKQILTAKLLPEVENSLESGEIKHRNHPGIRKINPLSIPEVLKNAVENVVSNHHLSESVLRKEAEELCNRLSWRRLPIEKEEIERKILEKIPSSYDVDNIQNLSDVLTKRQLIELKKSIYLEAGRWKPIVYNYHTCLAYLVGRLAPNYASVSHVFHELQTKEPTFKPETYFDFGSGVGSSLWAAHSCWPGTIKEYFCVDTSPDMNDLCESLITVKNTDIKHIHPVTFRQFLPASIGATYDLVVSAFSLLELQNSTDRLKVIDTLWKKTKDFMVIIEYGTVAGFSCVIDARDYILKVENDTSSEFSDYTSGAHVISPCPHDSVCPKFMEKANSSCGFTVPYHPQFPRGHQEVILKDWISYVILKKGPRPDKTDTSMRLPRIVKPVLKRPKHVVCRLCCSDGQMKEITLTRAKHGRNAYRCARASSQGDIFPGVIQPVEILEDEV